MKLIYLFIACILLTSCQKNAVISYKTTESGIFVTLQDGTLDILPMSPNAVRVKFTKDSLECLPELVLTKDVETPSFEVVENGSKIDLKTGDIHVYVDKTTGMLSYANAQGDVFLSEMPGTRQLVPDSIMGEKCYKAALGFSSPEDESIFGLGQFQDGNFNLKGVSRRLTQVNSQIALPFIFSSKGYGLLWHQYGLTDFNPADNAIVLEKEQQQNENEQLAEVTTTAGTQKVAQNQSLYKGKFSVPSDGSYSIFLDLGGMGNRHFVVIDGEACINQSNIWLPPTVGTLVPLKAGEHKVEVICKSDNTPQLSWKLKENTTTFCSPNAKALDYVVFYGPEADNVIEAYRNLSGNAPLFPKWAYGFWQCRERYTSGQQLVETVKEFRKRQLPMDVIVQDWQYWGRKGWGVPQFDDVNYANPSKFISELHDMNAHFNISIWSNPDKNSEIGKEYVARKRFVPDTKWLDYFNPETRKEYWNTLKENMFEHGVDSWWMDAVEPENDALTGEMTYAGPGDFYRLTYPLMVSKAVYEGQRATSSDKRVCILTRSAFLGQQRYGIINWSGDIGGTWDTYRRQIVAGLNYTVTGMPYWTTDIGGFFRPGGAQYVDKSFHELLIRWFQWGVFNPIFRMHGYQSETEPWKYGSKVEDNMRKMLNLRYALMPYIYSEAWQVTNNASTMMRPLVMDFRGDVQAVAQPYEYMFGKSFLVAPITEAGAVYRAVYLPKSAGWYNFNTGKYYDGGQQIPVNAALDEIPVFVKAGSIIPIGPKVQYASEKPYDNLEIRIYKGADATFTLYEDEGDNYNYETGSYSTIQFQWDNSSQKLTIGKPKGEYSGMLNKRKFSVVNVSQENGIGANISHADKEVEYNGTQQIVKF